MAYTKTNVTIIAYLIGIKMDIVRQIGEENPELIEKLNSIFVQTQNKSDDEFQKHRYGNENESEKYRQAAMVRYR